MIVLVGTVQKKILCKDDHSSEYYLVTLGVERNSGVIDEIRVRCFSKLADMFEEGKYVKVTGFLRTYEVSDNPYVHTDTMVYPSVVEPLTDYEYSIEKGTNECEIEGKISYVGEPRVTPKGTCIRDMTVLTERYSGDLDRIRCVVWGSDSSEELAKNDYVKLLGRFQSRSYLKNGVECMTHELSVSTLAKL